MGEFQVHHAKLFDYIPSTIQCLAYDGINKRLAVGRADNSIEIWRTSNRWYQESIIPGSDKRRVTSLTWVKGRLFSAGLQGNITEYDLKKNCSKVSHFYGHGFWCMAASYDHTRLALGCEDGFVRVYKIRENGVAFNRALNFQKERIVSLDWHTSDKFIVTGSIDCIRIWNVASGQSCQHINIQRAHKQQEVIVWCVKILKDHTIISGDSDGKTNFWNGHNGTLLHSLNSHRGPILSLCVNHDEDMICTSGVDPRIVQFAFVSSDTEGAAMEWVQSTVTRDHTHDVKALLITDDNVLISGGVDTLLCTSPLISSVSGKNKRYLTVKKQKYMPFPQKSLVHLAVDANLMLCQHQSSLEVWRLGATTAKLDNSIDGDGLPLDVPPCKLLQLKSKSGEQITCSAISPCGVWLAYSDSEKVRMYSMGKEPLVLNKVPVLPSNLYPSHLLEFTKDSSKLVSASNQGFIQVLSVEDISPKLLHSFSPMDQSISCFALGPSGSCIVADNAGRLKMYQFNPHFKEVQCNLPHHKPIMCMAINSSVMLFVVYVDRTFAEFNMKMQTYSKWWLEKQKTSLHPSWLAAQANIQRVEYNPTNPSQILLQEPMNFTILSKKKQFPKDRDTLFHRLQLGKRSHDSSEPKKPNHAFSICQKYRPLQFAGFTSDGQTLIAVERSYQAILEQLPPPLYRKKFGT